MEQCFCIALIDFQITKNEFLDLTPFEFSLLIDYKGKADRGKYQVLRNVVFNAGANLLRGKQQKEIKLFEDVENISDGEIDVESIKKSREELFAL